MRLLRDWASLITTNLLGVNYHGRQARILPYDTLPIHIAASTKNNYNRDRDFFFKEANFIFYLK